MKRWIITLAAVCLLIALGTGGALAAGHGAGWQSACPGWDGVCDNQGTGLCAGTGCGRFADADGDGVCDNRDTGLCAGASCGRFVDADGDGVCDNRGTLPRTGGGHHGRGAGRNACTGA